MPKNNEIEELVQYLSEPSIIPESSAKDIRIYWECRQFLRLRKPVYKFLCPSPATVFSERLFSLAGCFLKTTKQLKTQSPGSRTSKNAGILK